MEQSLQDFEKRYEEDRSKAHGTEHVRHKKCLAETRVPLNTADGLRNSFSKVCYAGGSGGGTVPNTPANSCT